MGHLAVELIRIKCQLVDPFVFEFYLQSDLFNFQKIIARPMVSFIQALAPTFIQFDIATELAVVSYSRFQSYSNR